MYRLPDALKPQFAEPWGPILSGDEAVRKARGRYVVTVGDVVTDTFRKAGIQPNVSIVDGKTRRHEVVTPVADVAEGQALVFPVENPAGSITGGLWRAIISAVSAERASVIHVAGEEDLAVLPAVLLGPEGAVVAYGQPPVTSLGVRDGGVVLVDITPESRDRVKQLLSKMEVA